MPDITTAFIAFIAGSVVVGAVIGWITRGNRCAQEKIAVNEGWQRQLEAQRTEHERLLEQNKTLMEQISQLQASGKDATNRARELSAALKEAFERRDQLQRELKEIRSSLEQAVRQREQLQSEVKSNEERGDSAQAALQEKDDKIFHLSRELDNWQNRLPPLIDRFRERDSEAKQLEDDLAAARARIDELERAADAGETRIEPVDQEALGDKLDASNDPTSVTQTGIEEAIDEADDDAAFAEAHAEAGESTDDDAELAEAHAEAGESADEGEDFSESRDDEPADEWNYEAHDEAFDDAHEEEDDETEAPARTADVTELHDREPGGLRDNLRLIKGIGPAIEKTLNELGIFRYHQIAEMTEYDIDRVAQRLKGFRTRIYREDWIGQARELQLKKSGT
jgi:predicted flap endonuclease-1-like 5' DNA nuclease/predicted  nucleic acid-binding Zn-ribbon protein